MILGHSTATMTMDLYGHLCSEATWQAMERLPVIPLMHAASDPPAEREQLVSRAGRVFASNARAASMRCTSG